MVVTTVFPIAREGKIVAGQTIRVDDQVRTNDSVYLAAVLQQVDAFNGPRNLKKASMLRKGLAGAGKT